MFEERLSDFLHYLRFEKRYSPHTLVSYENDLRAFRDYLTTTYGIETTSAVSHFHVRGWLASLKEEKMAVTTINRKMSSLSAFFKYLMRTGISDNNPVKKLHSQKLPERLPVALKESESTFLLEEVQFAEGFEGNTQRLICELLYGTGMRRNELLQLKERDIEWGLRQVRILGKGNKERLVPLSETLLDSLRDYIKEKDAQENVNSEYLLQLINGKPLYPNYIYRTVKRYMAMSTTMKKKSPHVLRHSFATHLLNNGANIQAIKELLGHSSLAATQIYTNTNIEKLKDIHRQNHPRG